MMKLKKLSLNDGVDIYEMLQEIDSQENGFHNSVKGMSQEDFIEWLAKEHGYDRGANLLGWIVPQFSYQLYAVVDIIVDLLTITRGAIVELIGDVKGICTYELVNAKNDYTSTQYDIR